MIQMYNVPATSNNWVHPYYCKELEKVLPVKTAFYWKEFSEKKCELVATIFDPDEYYSPVNDLMLQTSELKMFPAFTLAEMDEMLPDHTVIKKAGLYKAFCHYYPNMKADHSRKADALAMLVLEGIRQNIIDISSLKEVYSK